MQDEAQFAALQGLPPALAVRSDNADALNRRAHLEPPHPYRSPFVRDGARILHSRAFRRLAGKTQVFSRLAADSTSDHFRSRLTHTLEVAQIARTLAAAMGLNAELAEALALAHDIGHPPFGHAGEKALDRALQAHGLRFDHNLHALRIATWFEDRYAAFPGLNLTFAVREGIVKHSRDYSALEHPELAEYLLGQFPPLEAQLIDLADEIAYLTADIEDGIDSEILTVQQVRDGVSLVRRFHDAVQGQFPAAQPKIVVRETLKRMLDALVTDLMDATTRQVLDWGATTLDEIRRAPRRLATLSASVEAERSEAKQFLYENFYNSPALEEAHCHAEEVVSGLFAALVDDPSRLPKDHQEQIQTEGLARTVCDYIAGMTDSYIEQVWMRSGKP